VAFDHLADEKPPELQDRPFPRGIHQLSFGVPTLLHCDLGADSRLKRRPIPHRPIALGKDFLGLAVEDLIVCDEASERRFCLIHVKSSKVCPKLLFAKSIALDDELALALG
jgi:hypothetical protein